MNNISRWAIIILAVTVLLMGSMIIQISNQALDTLEDCTSDAFRAVRELRMQLTPAVADREISARTSEEIQRSMIRLDRAINTADHFYPDWKKISSGLNDLAMALGTYSMQVNGKNVESVLKDSKISDKELEFLHELLEDIELLLAPMLAEDGMNMRKGLLWNDIRIQLDEFCEKWDTWNWAADAPYELLNVN